MTRWSERIAGQASKMFALLAALTQLLATIETTSFTGLGPWGAVQIISGNLNLGAALLAMLEHCCEKGGGRGLPPSGFGDGGVIVLFFFAGTLNLVGAGTVYTTGPSAILLAGILSLVALPFELVATAIVLKASYEAAATTAGAFART